MIQWMFAAKKMTATWTYVGQIKLFQVAYVNPSNYTQGHKGWFEKTRTQWGGPGEGSGARKKK